MPLAAAGSFSTAALLTPTRSPVVAAAARLGAVFGVVTSTFRTPEHNRAVGGVPNSYHLKGMAIDIARRPGISHARIDSALRAAGYRLVESLDEGDHSHFAFATTVQPVPPIAFRSNDVAHWGETDHPGNPVAAKPRPLLLAADHHGTLELDLAAGSPGAVGSPGQ